MNTPACCRFVSHGARLLCRLAIPLAIALVASPARSQDAPRYEPAATSIHGSNTADPSTPAPSKRGTATLYVSGLVALPESMTTKRSAAWLGFEGGILVGMPYAMAGGTFSFGYGGTQSVVVNLAPTIELGTPLSGWCSLHLVGHAGLGMMTVESDTASGRHGQPDGRAFVSYGAILRVPILHHEQGPNDSIMLLLSARREHTHWFNSTLHDDYKQPLYVISLGLAI